MFRGLVFVMIASVPSIGDVSAQINEPRFIDLKGKKKVRLYFYDMTSKPLIFRPLTDEERLWIWGSKPSEITATSDFIADCRYTSSLETPKPQCFIRENFGSDVRLLPLAQRLFNDFRPQLDVPDFNPKNKRKNVEYEVKYRFSVNPKNYPFVYPKNDPDYGALIDTNLFGNWRVKIDREYPPVLLATKFSGILTFRCKVTTDYMLDCYGIALYPRQNEDMFMVFAKNIGAGQGAPATLTDGRSSVGTIFQGMIRFQIP